MEREQTVKYLEKIIQEKRNPLEVEAYEFLSNHGVKLLPYSFVTTKEEAEEATKKLNPERKYAVKVMSPKILHKSDFQAVLLNIPINEIPETFTKCSENFEGLDFKGVLIIPMAEDGIELLVGSTFDDTFGLITVFGIGGTLVEVIKDVTFGKAPVSFEDARLMINEIKSQKLLNGHRGLPKLDEVSMANLIAKISRISCEYKDIIREIDLNPIKITSNGVFPLDARIIFHPDKC